jgi:hypothetical protein
MGKLKIDHGAMLLVGRCLDGAPGRKRRRLMRYRAEVSYLRGKIGQMEMLRRIEAWRG